MASLGNSVRKLRCICEVAAYRGLLTPHLVVVVAVVSLFIKHVCLYARVCVCVCVSVCLSVCVHVRCVYINNCII